MSDEATGGPSLIRLGKLANGRQFDKLEELWPDALSAGDYSWRELLPIAGQVGRQGAVDRADALMDSLVAAVREQEGRPAALAAARGAAAQLPGGPGVRKLVRELYAAEVPDFADLDRLMGLLLADGRPLDEGVRLMDLYLQLRPGAYAVDRSQLVPGVVETLIADKGVLTVRYDDRTVDYGPTTLNRISPRPGDFFPALALSASRAMRATSVLWRVNGAWRRRVSSRPRPRPVSCWKSAWTSWPIASSQVR